MAIPIAPDIEALQLSPIAKAGAYALRVEFGAKVVFTSGRRTVESQASAMAENIVASGKRDWIGKTYASKEGQALNQWVKDNPLVVTKAALTAGLLGQIQAMGERAGRVSRHLTGDAFDVQPISEQKLGQRVTAAMRKLPYCDRFLTKEGGLVRWHAQFSLLIPAATPEERDEASIWRSARSQWGGKSALELTDAAVTFWLARWGAVENTAGGEAPFGADLQHAMRDLVRTVSWVTSRHGTAAGETMLRDPTGVGAPKSAWWRALGKTDGPPTIALRTGAISAHGLALQTDASLPAGDRRRLDRLGAELPKGNASAAFAAEASFFWVVPLLIVSANRGDDAYRFKDWRYSPLVLVRPRSQRLLDGAVRARSSAVGAAGTRYRDRLERALEVIALLDAGRNDA